MILKYPRMFQNPGPMLSTGLLKGDLGGALPELGVEGVDMVWCLQGGWGDNEAEPFDSKICKFLDFREIRNLKFEIRNSNRSKFSILKIHY